VTVLRAIIGLVLGCASFGVVMLLVAAAVVVGRILEIVSVIP
jgi:hypothetical protein